MVFVCRIVFWCVCVAVVVAPNSAIFTGVSLKSARGYTWDAKCLHVCARMRTCLRKCLYLSLCKFVHPCSQLVRLSIVLRILSSIEMTIEFVVVIYRVTKKCQQ